MTFDDYFDKKIKATGSIRHNNLSKQYAVEGRSIDKREGTHSRSSSSKHLMPLRLRTHTQRPSKKKSKDHDQAYLECAMSRNQEQNRRRSDQKGDGQKNERKAHNHVDAAFAIEMKMAIVGLF